MKNKITLLAISLILVFSACKKNENKEKQLAELKKEQSEIQTKIAGLETQLKAEGKLKPVKAEATPVAVQTVQLQPFSSYLEVQGRLDFDQNVSVSPKVPGVLTSVRVNRGDRVSKGQVLATIDASVLNESVAELKTGLELARTVFEKQKRLWDQKIGTEIQYLQAKNNKESLERRLSTLRQQQAQFVITAPISGVIDEFNPKVGEMVSPGTPIPVARIVNTSGLKVVADISESHAGKINRGDQAIVELTDLNREFPASVTVVSQTINAANRAFPIELHIKGNVDAPIRPNMIAVVKVKEYEKQQAIVLPVSLVQKDETTTFVYVIGQSGKDTVARRRKVTVGATYAGKTEIASGLSANDQVITAGQQNLNEGQLVSISK